MGDVIHTLAALQFVKKVYPRMRITWFVEEKFAPILEGNPHIERIVPLNLHGLKKDFSIKKLRDTLKTIQTAGPFDRIIDVQGLIKSAIVARAAGKPVAGLDRSSAKEGVAALLYHDTYAVNCADIAPMRFASLISQALDLKITESMMRNKAPYLFFQETDETAELADSFDKNRQNVLIITGASNASKTYPPERWIDVIDRLEGHNVLLVAGSESEREAASRIERETSARLLPPMSLNALKYAVSRCDLLIGGDTGPTHVAWAMNRPSIVLFGSTPKSMMMETPINVALTSGAKVDPCRFDKSDRSIATIDPAHIADEAQRLLG